MTMLSSKLRQATPGNLLYWCPGCQCPHGVSVRPQHSWGWEWNGDPINVEFSPSVLTHLGNDRCHCFVRGGQIIFLPDCWHSLAGQTVPLPDLPSWLRGDADEE